MTFKDIRNQHGSAYIVWLSYIMGTFNWMHLGKASWEDKQLLEITSLLLEFMNQFFFRNLLNVYYLCLPCIKQFSMDSAI